MKKILILSMLITLLTGCVVAANHDLAQFANLEPKAQLNGYKIYDLVEQKGLMCAEAIEFVGENDEYEYYLSCLKGDSIFVVKENRVLLLKDAISQKIFTLDQLVDLNIIGKMAKNN